MPSPGYSTSNRAAMQAEMDAQAATRPEQAFLGSYPGERQRDDEHAWILTYLDVLTLVIVVFVILLTFMDPRDHRPLATAPEPIQLAHPDRQALIDPRIASLVDGREGDDRFQGLAETEYSGTSDPAAHIERLQEQAPPGVDVVGQPGRAELRIQDDILFSTGEADLLEAGQILLEQLLPLLEEHPGTILIEGHTDNIPIATDQFPSNWELSAARASRVVRHLIDHGLPASQMRAVGRADTQPVTDNLTASNRARNRRVGLILETAIDAPAP